MPRRDLTRNVAQLKPRPRPRLGRGLRGGAMPVRCLDLPTRIFTNVKPSAKRRKGRSLFHPFLPLLLFLHAASLYFYSGDERPFSSMPSARSESVVPGQFTATDPLWKSSAARRRPAWRERLRSVGRKPHLVRVTGGGRKLHRGTEGV